MHEGALSAGHLLHLNMTATLGLNLARYAGTCKQSQ